MTQEGRFFSSLGQAGRTFIPGGAEVDGDLKVKKSKSMQLFFDAHPVCVAKAGAGPATGNAGDENLMMLPEGVLEYHILGTQTILGPVQVATGLDVSMDAENNDGVEFCTGILASNKCVFTVGTTPAFFARLKFAIADVSDTDDCVFGFRLAEAYQANVDDYDEMAALNVNAGDILFQNILNNGTTVATDTTDNWADGATHELKVLVSAAGVVTYEIDGRAPTATVAFTFDATEVVVPFFFFLHADNSSAGIVLKEFECGLQD